METKIRSRVSKILRRYMRQRIAANLPPYVWGGPYPRRREKQSKEVRGEVYRRMLVYSLVGRGSGKPSSEKETGPARESEGDRRTERASVCASSSVSQDEQRRRQERLRKRRQREKFGVFKVCTEGAGLS